MYVRAIGPDDAASQSSLLDSMFRLRARVFHARLGWQVKVEEGREHDLFDTLGPVYIVVADDGNAAIASARLLPAVGPTMLADVFSTLLGGKPFPAHARMVESSRFCVDTHADAETCGRFGLNGATVFLFAGILEWCLISGVSEIATVTDIRFERILKRASWPLARYGEPQLIGDVRSVAGSLPVTRSHFEAIRPPSYRSVFSASLCNAA